MPTKPTFSRKHEVAKDLGLYGFVPFCCFENDDALVGADGEAVLVQSTFNGHQYALLSLCILHKGLVGDPLATKPWDVAHPFRSNFSPALNFFSQFTLQALVKQ